MTTEADALSAIALDVARDAAALLLGGYRTRPAPTEKARADLVTEWDLRSEARIRELLAARTPGVAIVAEEAGGERGGLTWYCDPLDGTMNFVHGHPFFAVSIGAVDAHGPLAGAVVAPALGLAYRGGRGVGAFRGDEPCRVSQTSALASALLATGFPPDRTRAPDNNFPAFERVKPRVHGVRRCGSAAIDCCFVADGTYDGYWERALHAWDIAAGAAIALGAGARLTARTGGALDLSVGHLLLTNGLIHDELLALVAVD